MSQCGHCILSSLDPGNSLDTLIIRRWLAGPFDDGSRSARPAIPLSLPYLAHRLGRLRRCWCSRYPRQSGQCESVGQWHTTPTNPATASDRAGRSNAATLIKVRPTLTSSTSDSAPSISLSVRECAQVEPAPINRGGRRRTWAQFKVIGQLQRDLLGFGVLVMFSTVNLCIQIFSPSRLSPALGEFVAQASSYQRIFCIIIVESPNDRTPLNTACVRAINKHRHPHQRGWGRPHISEP